MTNEQQVRYIELESHPGYRVGDDGTIQTDMLLGSKIRRRTGVWRDLKPYIHPRFGYHYVDLRTGPKRRNARVHSVVLEAFVGPKPSGMECLHGDGDRSNNRLSNLRWGTRSENMQDAVKHGTIKRGVRQELAKLDDEKVRKIRAWMAVGCSNRFLADQFGVCNSVISEIRTGKAWKHVAEVVYAD